MKQCKNTPFATIKQSTLCKKKNKSLILQKKLIMQTQFTLKTVIGELLVTTNDETVTGISLNSSDIEVKPCREFEIEVAREIKEFLSGERESFEFSYEFTGSAFQVMVWKELLNIPYGETATYSEIARRIGKPGASRAVGMACNRNPLLLVVPCHRVVSADGKLTGFVAGFERKRMLLELESAASRITRDICS